MFSALEIDVINKSIKMEKKINKNINLTEEVYYKDNDILSLKKKEIFNITICLANFIKGDKDNFVESIIDKLLKLIDN